MLIADLGASQLPLADLYIGQFRAMLDGTVIGRNTQEVAHVATEESKQSGPLGKLALAGNAIYLGFEQLGGNEALLGAAGGLALHALHEPAVIESLAAGGAAGVSSFMLVQAPLGLLTSRNVEKFPKTISKYQELLGRDYAADERRGLGRRFITAMTFGSAASVIGESVRNPELTRSERNKTALGSAALIGAGVFGLGGVLGAVSKTMESIGWKTAADTLVNVVTNPLPWIGTFGTLNYFDWKKRKQTAKEA